MGQSALSRAPLLAVDASPRIDFEFKPPSNTTSADCPARHEYFSYCFGPLARYYKIGILDRLSAIAGSRQGLGRQAGHARSHA